MNDGSIGYAVRSPLQRVRYLVTHTCCRILLWIQTARRTAARRTRTAARRTRSCPAHHPPPPRGPGPACLIGWLDSRSSERTSSPVADCVLPPFTATGNRFAFHHARTACFTRTRLYLPPFAHVMPLNNVYCRCGRSLDGLLPPAIAAPPYYLTPPALPIKPQQLYGLCRRCWRRHALRQHVRTLYAYLAAFTRTCRTLPALHYLTQFGCSDNAHAFRLQFSSDYLH